MATKIEEDDDYLKPDIVARFLKKFKSATKGSIERHTIDSLDWFRKRISKDVNISRTALLKDTGDYRTKSGKEDTSLIGKLYYFNYEAEGVGNSELGVYDEYPMVFIFNSTKTKEGKQVLWGLNLHYATPAERATLYMELLKLKTTKGWSEKTKLKMSWNLIKGVASHRLYKKCVHAYRVDRMKSRLVEIKPEDWEVAVFLQLQRWKRPSLENSLYQSDIRKQLRSL